MTHYYRVRKGDTVLLICLKHRITWDQFAAMNPDYGIFGHKHFQSPTPGELVIVKIDPFRHLKFVNSVLNQRKGSNDND